MNHWPFWFGGIVLGAAALLFTGLVRRPFGVSGAVGCALAPPAEPVAEASGPLGRPLRFVEALLFLGSIAAGSAVSALMAGTWGVPLQQGLGPAFQRLFGAGEGSWVLVLGGGVLVGLGTQMAHGCTSGHGLIGVARMQMSSLVATAVFFGTAIAVSIAVDAVLS